MSTLAKARNRNAIMRRGIATASLAILGLLLAPAVGQAKIVELIKYTGENITGEGSTQGVFNAQVGEIEVHQATGNILVQTNGSSGWISQFNQAGSPVNFSALGVSSINTAATGVPDLAIDNSLTGTNGNFYSAPEAGPIRGWNAAGTEFAGNFPLGGHQNNCGHAIDPQGDLWVANWSGSKLVEYNSLGSPTGKSFSTPSPCRIDIDAEGNFYVIQYQSPVRKYNSDGELLYIVDNNGASQAIAVNPTTGEVFVDHGGRVDVYDNNGAPITSFGQAEGSYLGLQSSQGVSVNAATGKIYVTNRRSSLQGVNVFAPTGPIVVPDVTTDPPTVFPTEVTLRGKLNPDGIDTTKCVFEWGVTTNYGNTVPCAEGQVHSGSDDIAVSAHLTNLQQGQTYNYRLVAENENGVPSVGTNRQFKPQGPPVIIDPFVSEVNTDGARLNAKIDPNGGTTEYHIEWGTEDCAVSSCEVTQKQTLPNAVGVQPITLPIGGLQAGHEYHFRVIAENENGITTGGDNVFHTFPNASKDPDTCPNAHVRQQTGAHLLFDCRAYELVSAANAGGYDVASNLVPGQEPLTTSPDAGDSVLYTMHHGTIPGIAGSPTNYGRDPYVATRGENGWTTRYVGIPSDGTPDQGSFASDLIDMSGDLRSFAFGGPNLCNPCFPGGSGIPVRTADGSLIQGMAGSLPGSPVPAGHVAKHLSGDGTHLVFGSESKFEPEGNAGSVTIYDRNLVTGKTQVASTLPSGATMTGDVGQLDISADGTRIVVGQRLNSVGENDLWHLYLHVDGNSKSIDLTPGTTSGVAYVGMTSDGSTIYFVTRDQLTGGDTDSGVDLYRAVVSGATASLTRVSTGTPGGNSDLCDPVPGGGYEHWNSTDVAADCSVVAFAGGAGVASGDGTVYFLSPERLDGPSEGTLDEPNLYAAIPGGDVEFVATIEPNSLAIRNGLTNTETHSYADFQVSANGDYAAFASTRSLTGFANLGFSEVYRYATQTDALDCASCATTGAAPSTDTTLSAQGLNLTEDGRVFFTSSEALVLRDTNDRKDAYQWKDGAIQVVSTGNSLSDSGLLSVDPDGVNAFFFTREVLVPQDRNGTTMKIYVAREGGGFPVMPDPVPCQASDECHGPSSAQPPTPLIGTLRGDGGQHKAATTAPRRKRCGRGKVLRRGRCVPRKRKKAKRRKRAAKRRNGADGRRVRNG